MPNLSPYFRFPSESPEEQEERLAELLRAQVGIDPAVTSHDALRRGYAPPPGAGQAGLLTDRRYTAPPEPEDSGITDLAEIEATEQTLPQFTPRQTPVLPSPRNTMPSRDEEEALYAQAQADNLGVVPVTDRGIPPEPTAPPSADPRLAPQINPFEELERIRAMPLPDHTTAGSRVATKGGKRPNMYDMEDEFGFDPFAQQARARELYAQANVPSERRWEDEFLADRKRYTDDDIQRGYMLHTLLGSPEQGMAFRKMAREEQVAYDKGLYEARDRDLASQRVSPALAEAIAASGMVSPESAVNLRMNDPAVKNFGQYASQGMRARGQDYGMGKTYITETGKTERADLDRRAALERMIVGKALGIQAALANKGALDDDTTLDAPTKIEWAVNRLMKAAGISRDQAVSAFGGDFSSLSPEQAKIAEQAIPDLRTSAQDPASRRRISDSSNKLEGEADTKKRVQVETYVDKARSDPKYRLKFKNDWEAAATPLREAIAAWKQMSDDGKKAFVQWAPTGIPGTIGKFITSPKDQQLAGSVRGLLNAYVKANAGSAVTGSEWDRVAAEIGIPTGSWSPFQGTGQIEDFFRRSGKLLGTHRRNFEQEIGAWDAITGE